MEIAKGTILEIKHSRKGRFTAIAERDFDTETETFYPVSTTKFVDGMVNDWDVGESIPCRGSFCTFEIIRTPEPA